MADNQSSSLADRFKDWVQDNRAQQPSLGAELRAMGREMIKDVRGKMMESVFGSQEVSTEPGVPLNPTPQMVTNDLGTLGKFENILDGYANRGVQAQGRDQDRGIER